MGPIRHRPRPLPRGYGTESETHMIARFEELDWQDTRWGSCSCAGVPIRRPVS